MRRATGMTVAVGIVVALAALVVSGWAARPDDRTELLKAREAVWRAWFDNDTKRLAELVPADTIVISSGDENWGNQAVVFKAAANFHEDGETDSPRISAHRSAALRRCGRHV